MEKAKIDKRLYLVKEWTFENSFHNCYWNCTSIHLCPKRRITKPHRDQNHYWLTGRFQNYFTNWCRSISGVTSRSSKLCSCGFHLSLTQRRILAFCSYQPRRSNYTWLLKLFIKQWSLDIHSQSTRPGNFGKSLFSLVRQRSTSRNVQSTYFSCSQTTLYKLTSHQWP